MHKRILIAYDGSQASRYALDECLTFDPRDAEIHIVAVIHDLAVYTLAGEYVPALAFEQDAKLAEKDLEAAQLYLAAHGLPARTHAATGDPIEVIARLAKELDIDLLILGHKREQSFAARWWKGSTGFGLMDRVHCSILIARGEDTEKDKDRGSNSPEQTPPLQS
ncbi:MAG: universal stress protein [Burkholderiales bacterium]|jgi:nucleotide-binding universal stress UspA family protein|nr:universal stress protein [Burkholderiales bacterium]